MSSQIKFSIIALLFLASCGFKPMYGAKNNKTEPSIAGVAVETSTTDRRMAQQLKTELEDKLNPDGSIPVNPHYRLTVSLKSKSLAIGVARDGTVSRYNIYLDSGYSLFRTSDNKQITTGSLTHVSSYNNSTNQYFSTFVSEQDAIKRGLTELAELYRQRLSPFLSEESRAAAEKSAIIKQNEPAEPGQSMIPIPQRALDAIGK